MLYTVRCDVHCTLYCVQIEAYWLYCTMVSPATVALLFICQTSGVKLMKCSIVYTVYSIDTLASQEYIYYRVYSIRHSNISGVYTV